MNRGTSASSSHPNNPPPKRYNGCNVRNAYAYGLEGGWCKSHGGLKSASFASSSSSLKVASSSGVSVARITNDEQPERAGEIHQIMRVANTGKLPGKRGVHHLRFGAMFLNQLSLSINMMYTYKRNLLVID